MARVRDPKATRRRILAAAHEEFWRRGYRAGSLNGIVEAAGVTKGALFHHFRDKNALALAVVEEVLAPELRDCWLVPLEGDGDALELLGRLLAGELERIEEVGGGGAPGLGSALVKLAADVSEEDGELWRRVGALFGEWREAVARTLGRGQSGGAVHPSVVPADEAAFLVDAMAGMAVSGQAGRGLEPLRASHRAASAYLETLRAPE